MSFSLRAKRVLAGAATGALALSMMPAGVAAADEHLDVCAGAPESGFIDKGTTHADNIDCLFAYGITTGQTATTFGTFEDMTRGQAATFFVNFASVATDGAILDEVGDEDVPFTDIAGTTHESNIEAAHRLELVQGTTATTYSPNEPMTREQFATVLYNAHTTLGVEFDAEYDDAFTDTGNSVHEDNINALAHEGIISGTTATTYSPQLNVVRGQLATLFMQSAQFLDDQVPSLWTDDRPWAPTNQTFAVNPDDFSLVSAVDGTGDNERSFEVSGADVDEIVIDLADAENVSVDNGIVTFEEDGTTGTAELGGQTTTLGEVVIDGVTFTGVSFGDPIDVSGASEFTFEIEGAAATDIEEVVPVVYVGDDSDDLAIDEDGAPEDGFGIGGTTFFVNPELTKGADVTGVIGQEAEVSVQVEDGATEPLEVADIPIEVIVHDDAAGTDHDLVPAGNVIEQATVTTDAEGEATFAFEADDGVSDGDERYVTFKWEGSGSLAGLDDTTDGVTVTWAESDGVTATVTAEADAEYLGVGSTATVTAEVVDAAGVGVEGIDVEFDVATAARADFTATRTTDADGVATFTYSHGGDADIDTVTTNALNPDDSTVDATDDVTLGWFVEADADAALDARTDQIVLSADLDAQILFLADGDLAAPATLGTMVWVDYSDAELYAVDDSVGGDGTAASAVTFATWESELEEDGDVVYGTSQFLADERATENDTTYILIIDPA